MWLFKFLVGAPEVIAFVARFYGLNPMHVIEWKERDLKMWYDEGVKLWEQEMKMSGCPWRG